MLMAAAADVDTGSADRPEEVDGLTDAVGVDIVADFVLGGHVEADEEDVSKALDAVVL